MRGHPGPARRRARAWRCGARSRTAARTRAPPRGSPPRRSPPLPAGKCGAQTSRHSASWSMVCQGVSVPPQSKITADTAMDVMRTERVRQRLTAIRVSPRTARPAEITAADTPGPDECCGRARRPSARPGRRRGARRGDLEISRTTPRARGALERDEHLGLDEAAAGDREPGDQLVAGRVDQHDLRRDHRERGAARCRRACARTGWCSALISAASSLSARCRVAVSHRPLPGIVCAPVTHRSTLTGTKDTGSVALGAFAGQPAQAGWPARGDAPAARRWAPAWPAPADPVPARSRASRRGVRCLTHTPDAGRASLDAVAASRGERAGGEQRDRDGPRPPPEPDDRCHRCASCQCLVSAGHPLDGPRPADGFTPQQSFTALGGRAPDIACTGRPTGTTVNGT